MNVVLLAHQGGWDEALLVTIPIAFMFVVLWFAKRKAERLGEGDSTANVDSSAQPSESPAIESAAIESPAIES